ncbi:hypothetical protein FB451DRAFT_1173334 [Mycena latifolia]|nr:hypothetical protein FB451DRAFT_1173334 [Mycena latifolia]
MRYASYLGILVLGTTPAVADGWGCPDTNNKGTPLQNSVLLAGSRTVQCYYGAAARSEVCTYDLTVGVPRQLRRAAVQFMSLHKGWKFARWQFVMSSPRQAVQ